MSDRAFRIVLGVVVAVVVLQVAILVRTTVPSGSGTIVGRAVNAGIPLGPDEGRVLVYPAGARDRVLSEASLGEPIPAPSGTYDLRVRYTRSQDRQEQWVEAVLVGEGERVERRVEFTAGELVVDAAVGTGQTPDSAVVVYVFRPGDRDTLVTTMAASERVVLEAGDYDLRVVLVEESEEHAVEWLPTVRIEAGLATERTVAFERGLLHVRAINGDLPLPVGAVALTVHRAGDTQREVVAQGLAAVSLGLAVGRYDIQAVFTGSNDQPERWIRDLEITENQTTDHAVRFSSGNAVVRAATRDGAPLEGFQAYVYYYRAGDHTQPVTYAPAGRPVVLTAGTYDLRAQFFRSHDQPDVWRRGIEIRAGQTVGETIQFASGRVLLRAYDAAGAELVGDTVFVYVHSAGERTRPLVVARSGEELRLTEGVYDLRANDTRVPEHEVWITDVRLSSGAFVERAVTLGAVPDPGQEPRR